MYRKNAWIKNKDNLKAVMDFAEGYKDYISFSKTERLATQKAVELLEKAGYVNGYNVKSVKPGDKLYFVNKNKNVAAYVIGNRPLREGIRVLGAHIDSPRLDFKEHPIYQKNDFALADTHYYGGIKKYQWVTIPLALHGVIVRKDGKKVVVNIGEDPKDPVVGITDLLIHLSADQMQKSLARGIEGEDLDVSLGSLPLDGENSLRINMRSKKRISSLLKSKSFQLVQPETTVQIEV